MIRLHFAERIKKRLEAIYGTQPFSEPMMDKLLDEIMVLKDNALPHGQKWTEENIILITYGDTFRNRTEAPLSTLYNFLREYLSHVVSHVHILPFYPFSSDDGFSVIDFKEVNSELGAWKDISAIGKDFYMMFDLVINHISQQSEWFQNFIALKEPGKDFFIETDPAADLSEVVRPRSLPLITAFDTVAGKKYVWTTFSADQVDLNYRNPVVLHEMLRVFLFYLSKGARIIRLDAIAFLWKEPGTTCLHLPQTHEIVRLIRDIADMIDPSILIITETNVPDHENLSYFGAGDEADMVYQFALPPLLLNALFTSDSKYLNKWASGIPEPPAGCTYYNFTASHDGIGVRPLEGLLAEDEVSSLIHGLEKQGAMISTRKNSAHVDVPYEINITYFDALKSTSEGPDEYQLDRFICSQTIMMSFKGIPAFYIHSLLGTGNDYEGVARSGRARSINRHKWNIADLTDKLKRDTIHSYILKELSRRILIRKNEKAFHPDTPQRIISAGKDVFVLVRGYSEELLMVANLTSKTKILFLKELLKIEGSLYDLIDSSETENLISLRAYQVCWIKRKS